MRFIGILLILTALSGCLGSSKRNQEAADLRLQIGTTHFENGNYPFALKELLMAESLDPSNPLIQNNLGLTYFMRERYEDSARHFSNAISLKSDYTDARNNLARTYIELNRFSEAQKELTTVINDLTFPAADRAYINLGILNLKLKKYAAARAALNNALKTQKESCLAHSYIGRAWFEEQNYPFAVEALERAVGFCQRHMFDEPHYYSALAWYRSGDKNRATIRLKEVVQLYPDGKYRDKAKAMLELINKGGAE